MSSIKQSFSSRITSRVGVTSMYHCAQGFYMSCRTPKAAQRTSGNDSHSPFHPPESSAPAIRDTGCFSPQLLPLDPPVALGLSESPCLPPSRLFLTSDEAASLGRIFLSFSICCFLSPTVRAVTSSPGQHHSSCLVWSPVILHHYFH